MKIDKQNPTLREWALFTVYPENALVIYRFVIFVRTMKRIKRL